MAKLAEIVTIINNNLKATQFAAKRFQRGEFYGIAEQIKSNNNGEIKPGVVSNSGAVTKIVISDTLPFIIYHRLLNYTSEYVEIGDFGDRKNIVETASMRLVLIAHRPVIQLTKEQLLTGVAMGMPLGLTRDQRVTNSLKGCDINPGSFIVDPLQVFKDEFNISEDLLKINTVMFAHEYEVVTAVDNTCFDLC